MQKLTRLRNPYPYFGKKEAVPCKGELSHQNPRISPDENQQGLGKAACHHRLAGNVAGNVTTGLKYILTTSRFSERQLLMLVCRRTTLSNTVVQQEGLKKEGSVSGHRERLEA